MESGGWRGLVLALVAALATLGSGGCGGGSGGGDSGQGGGGGGGGALAPVAAFELAPSGPVAGQPVSFTDASTNAPTSWTWSFGDGGTSSAQHPTHAFAAAGAYTVTLTAGNAAGTSVATRSVTVAPALAAPVAAFTLSPSAPTPGQAVTFSDGSSGSPTAWSWSFGDGATSTAQSPTHAYAAAGTYTVTLTATNAAGSGSTSQGVTVSASAFSARWVRVPGGSFEMGDHLGFVDPAHPSDELPLHTVTLSPFYVSTTLVTNLEYAAFLNAALAAGTIEVRTGVVYPAGGANALFYTAAAVPQSTISLAGGSFSARAGRELHPVTGVRWFGAAAYANWLSAREGYLPCYDLSTGDCALGGNGYRLPTEAEWEFAARGGQTNAAHLFPWAPPDTNVDGRIANWEGSGDPWEAGDLPHTTPVGFYDGSLQTKAVHGWPAADETYQTRDGSNALGLHDMSGNVWEWVNDWYSSTYYQDCVTGGVTTDPPGPATGTIFADHGGLAYRGLRGGNWWNGGGQQFYGHGRISNRNPSWSLGGPLVKGLPDADWLQVGFRLVRPDRVARTVGLMLDSPKASPGYTLMSPMHSNTTYLLDNAGNYVRKWVSTGEPGRSSYLLEDGHMFRAKSIPTGGPSTGGGEGGRVEEYDWEGNLVWAFDYYGPTYIAHHDFKVLPNGNVLILASEKKTLAEAVAAGFNPSLLDASITGSGAGQGYMLPDYLIEVKPTRPSGGTIVWEWHVWDHLIQDFDATKANYGVVASHPERIDPNGGGKVVQFWNHANGIDYHAALDQIIVSVRGNSELVVIDHGTTTAQAAGSAGGRQGKGGDVLYRWGNPQQYDRGAAADRRLYQQHHTHWIEPGLPGAGNILVFNNGIGRGYSTVDEIVPPVDATGAYALAAGAAYGPSAPVWSYAGTPTSSFYSAEISGAQRLPSGNTLITEGVKGNLFEVTPAGEKVWQYVNPVTSAPLKQGSAIPPDPGKADQLMNGVFRVTRYGPDFPGLVGRDLTPIGPIETP